MLCFYILSIIALTNTLYGNAKNDICEEKERARYAHALIQEIFENYPEYVNKLLEYHSEVKKFNMKNETYRGFIRQMRRNNKYELLIADAYAYNFKNKVYESGRHPNTVLYQCDKVIRYCSGNPKYCEYHEGSSGSNIILVSPHNGYLQPESMPSRNAGCLINNQCVFEYDCDQKVNAHKDFDRCLMKDVGDENTQQISKLLSQELEQMTGERPHLILNNLHRQKIDMNRKKPLATFDHPETNQAYDDFHDLIERAKSSLNGERGLILDLHGNAQSPHWNMFGYDIKPIDLNAEKVDENKSSIKSLAKYVKVDFDGLLRGENSLSHLMEKKGYKTVPSMKNRYPHDKPYFRGDQIITRHGSRDQGNVDAILVEIYAEYRRKSTYRKFTKDLAKSVVEYMDLNYKKQGCSNIKKCKEKNSNKKKNKKKKKEKNKEGNIPVFPFPVSG